MVPLSKKRKIVLTDGALSGPENGSTRLIQSAMLA
jgi:hypothetical protein